MLNPCIFRRVLVLFLCMDQPCLYLLLVLKKFFKFGGQLFGQEATGLKIAEELDNLILGPMSDNQTLARMLPSAVHNIWAEHGPRT
jgi:hypothetical protein